VQIFKGTLRILEIVVDKETIEYQCSVFGELGGFMTTLGNKKLENLDFSAYDHVYNTTNITASWDAARGEGYFYPLIDYGNVSTNKVDFQYTTFRPAIYIKEYIDKIFANIEYTYECDFFATDYFKRLVIPHNQKQLTKTTSDLNNAVLTAMVGFLESRNFKNPSSEFIAITILKQAKTDGYDAYEILRTLKGTDTATLSGMVAEILNYNRFKTSTLGVVQSTSPVEDIKRNILA
jgi:hypothetical protein